MLQEPENDIGKIAACKVEEIFHKMLVTITDNNTNINILQSGNNNEDG